MSTTDGAALLPAYDYIVVGGGSAGCVLAGRLAENPDVTVLLIEAGPDGRGRTEITNPAAWAALPGGDLDWGYEYAPSEHVLGRSIAIPRGRVLGGCSATNAMLWYRGHRDDYDAWERAGAKGWSYEGLLPYFRRAEDWEGGATDFRGTGGPLRIERPRDPHPIAAALLDAAAELGMPVIDDANAADNEGATLANLNISDGRRHSVVDGYLASAPANLTLVTESSALGLGFAGDRCISVSHLVDGVVRHTHANVEVVLALGAFGTPQLLLRSGIGDPIELRRLGVDVRAALPGVGRNLQDHPLLMGINFRARRPLGPVRDNGGGAILNWRSAGADRPDLHAFVVQGRHADAAAAARYQLDGDVFAISPGLMRSRSTGYLRLHSAEPGGAVEIQPNFLAEPGDLAALVEAVDLVQDLAGTRAYQALVDGPAMPAGRLSDLDKVRFVREHCATFFHPCGTAAMGDGPDAVVDSQLRVFGTTGLRVADASVMPSIPSCNTQAPVVAIAERAAALLRDEPISGGVA